MALRLFTAASIAALMAGSAQAEMVLHVLHTNDLHNRIEPINKYDSTCDQETQDAGECFGGVARVAAKVRELRDKITSEGGNVVVLDAGDQYQGSLFYTTYKGTDVAEFMTDIGYDAMSVGNHEFDDGPEGLAVLADGVEFPISSGNLDLSQSNVLKSRIDDTVTLDVGGQKIGIVSALATDTPEISSPGPDVIVTDDIEALKADVKTLTDQGVNKIIALTHVGYLRDQEIAREVPGIDAIIGGHSHTLLGEGEDAAGPYPTMVSGPDGVEVPVATAASYSRYLGHLILTFDDEGKLIKAEGKPILLDSSVPEDETIVARVKEMAAPIEELRQKVVAETAAPIDGDRINCRARECEMGDLVADAMLDRVKNQGMSIAIANGGGLRASIAQGQVTMGDVYSVLPFQNTLATFRLKGADVVSALENGASKYEEGAGRFAQVAGLKYTVDPSAEAGSRISEVMVRKDGGWSPIDPAATYGVVSNNYMRAGGDGYSVFAANATDAYDFGPDLAQVLADYLAAQGAEYKPAMDGRITVKGE
ncbi:MAG: bifunctional metallophosphatase/5'-nucleotidase [Paracoccus sp. (in: a-proteobacteria)]|jgi:5'-nucleotidase|uniref:bifunctional metallophosphatase/5'-nucleotidase n=1 Tax=unclassified Paracoccus (in: a-proteobacteria) TaxID=2688777 RepID=UPI000C370521|nr:MULTISPECIES: bifunctional metallophosphatase/5'-nucleotidase [unclassified Paracoccus (in: a-proteobacteria)]MAN57076.1 multifunctional 2',3'-cyclic-nucleotide 2'-phosphodiesterase/5'-nucleotidase/3'-nucleotidase [Paracoccus sp. (in: a-proteobacteria)]MBA48769.1 multifunctional 2',3'-cyclic-nucleotide 2'-phosphodiesterase/5'-nucleotidase/3'-nucleotidase [Paracoccus sp. (in: a-proteobacteria)]HIC64568.1 multifunctional 2',3'-cyclic-nucleotide 2'-phosphodiesterase/5'-nucleotidase/3'-nucleotida|tara:strand:+ start:5399 stop:7006 length:1608 start_codon:yes stop_codon:yes gene_type:complete